MADALKLYREYFLEYSSYVVKERAIPRIEDGFKPVQRRIIHTLLEMDNGLMHKVANVVGQTMKYHPHGDGSISDALVNLETSKYFIEGGGSFKNILTGDEASAPRYIECRILPFAKKVLYSPNITEYVPTYDVRNKEPVVFPAKLPVVLLQGVKGLAVGMSTEILPYNPHEVIDAMKCAIESKPFEIYPDFPTGGIMDVSEYNDGKGRVKIRSKVELDEKSHKIIIREIPYTTNTDILITSIDKAAKAKKVRVVSINDLTSNVANIEIEIEKEADLQNQLSNLYVYTDVEKKISSLNPLLIKDGHPVIMGVSEIIKFHAQYLQEILTKELQYEKSRLIDKYQQRTLERIFIEERIYKKIETLTTQEEINRVVIESLEKFKDEFVRDLNNDDVKHLLDLPIRRISLFDINKNREEIEVIKADIEKTENNLSHIKRYAISVLKDLDKSLPANTERKTKIESFSDVRARDVAQRDMTLYYNKTNGYIGYELKNADSKFAVSIFDKVLCVFQDGRYEVINVPNKRYIGENLFFLSYAEKKELENVVFTIIFLDKTTKALYIKRTKIRQFKLETIYSLLPDGEQFETKKISIYNEAKIILEFKAGKIGSLSKAECYFSDYDVTGQHTAGKLLTRKEVQTIKVQKINPEEKPSAKLADKLIFGTEKTKSEE